MAVTNPGSEEAKQRQAEAEMAAEVMRVAAEVEAMRFEREQFAKKAANAAAAERAAAAAAEAARKEGEWRRLEEEARLAERRRAEEAASRREEERRAEAAAAQRRAEEAAQAAAAEEARRHFDVRIIGLDMHSVAGHKNSDLTDPRVVVTWLFAGWSIRQAQYLDKPVPYLAPPMSLKVRIGHLRDSIADYVDFGAGRMQSAFVKMVSMCLRKWLTHIHDGEMPVGPLLAHAAMMELVRTPRPRHLGDPRVGEDSFSLPNRSRDEFLRPMEDSVIAIEKLMVAAEVPFRRDAAAAVALLGQAMPSIVDRNESLLQDLRFQAGCPWSPYNELCKPEAPKT